MKFIWKYLKKYKNYVFLNFISVIGFVLIEIGIPTLFATGINNKFQDYNNEYIFKLGLLMLAFTIVGLLFLIVLAYSTNKVVNKIIRDIRLDLFKKIQEYSHEEYEKFGISRLITNTGNDSFAIMQFLTMALRTGIIAPLMFLASFVMIFMKSKTIALITLLAVPIMLIAIGFINKITKPLSIDQQKGLDNINLNIRENLSGLRVIRAFNNEDFQMKRFADVNNTYVKISEKMFKTIALISPTFTIVFCFVLISVVLVGTNQISAGIIEYGTLAAFIEYVFHALFSFLMLSTVFMMYPRVAVAANRIKEVLDETPSIQNKINGVKKTDTEGFLEFNNVTFAYADNSEEPVLRKISFTAQPGETVAFIGSTGSGKSTLVQLIPRFFDVTSGEIKIDGVNIKDYDINYLRNKIGYVPQRATLFSGTIEENLRFGNPNATQEDLELAAEISQAKDFIEEKNNNYQEILSEGGTNLSGGQKQRLCIGRALVRKPPIYIFDDSFSALDYKTDATLRARLKKETTNTTVLIVAQRVGTIMDADKILVINEGRVIDTGTHKELLKRCSIYYEIALSQLSEEELGI